MAIRRLDSGQWQVDVQAKDPAGKTRRVRRNVRTKGTAIRVEREIRDAIQSGDWERQHAPTVPTLGAWFARYDEIHLQVRCAPGTRTARHGQWRRIAPELADRRLDEITRADLARVTAKLAKKFAPGTVNNCLALVAHMLRLAVEHDVIAWAPTPSRLSQPRRHPEYLTPEQLRRLVEALDDPWRTMALLGSRAGLRAGEIYALHWSSIAWRRRQLEVRHNVSGHRVVAVPKGHAHRTVPLPSDVLEALRTWRKASIATPSPLVFPRPDGSHWYRTALGHRLERVGQRVLGRHVWPHLLRHTYATHLRAAGVELGTIQLLLGHAGIQQTERYAHARPGGRLAEAVAALEGDTEILRVAIASLDDGGRENG